MNTLATVCSALTAAPLNVREANYDIAIDLQGTIRSAMIARFSGANRAWLATQHPREAPARLLYTADACRGTRGCMLSHQGAEIVI